MLDLVVVEVQILEFRERTKHFLIDVCYEVLAET